MKFPTYRNIEKIVLLNGDIIYPKLNTTPINMEYTFDQNHGVGIISCKGECNWVSKEGIKVTKPGIIMELPITSILYYLQDNV